MKISNLIIGAAIITANVVAYKFTKDAQREFEEFENKSIEFHKQIEENAHRINSYGIELARKEAVRMDEIKNHSNYQRIDSLLGKEK